MDSPRRNLALIVLGAAVVASLLLFAVGRGLGKESVPSDAVAVVDDVTVEAAGIEDGVIPRSAFDDALQQAAARQGLDEVPAEDNPQYEQLAQEALGDLLDIAWISGEAEERGVEATDREVQQNLQQTINQNFENRQEYQEFIRDSGFTQEDVELRIRLQLLSEKIQTAIAEENRGVDPEEAEKFYDANISDFTQPEQRDVRLVRNRERAQVEQALEQLEADDSEATWNRVAKRFSNDQTSKNQGGLRRAVTEGLLEEELDAAVFDAAQGELVGPVETPLGFYVFQVVEVQGGGPQPLDQVLPQIQQQLEGQFQQEAFSAFLADYRDKWIERTVCADDLATDRCDNFEPPTTPCPDPNLPEDQQKQQVDSAGCPAPVATPAPAAPGSIVPFVTPTGQPQRPHPPGADQEVPSFPGGVPGGAPGGVPGGVPPAGAGGAQGAAPGP